MAVIHYDHFQFLKTDDNFAFIYANWITITFLINNFLYSRLQLGNNLLLDYVYRTSQLRL